MSDISACPACAAAPLARDLAERQSTTADIVLSLPDIHCASCMTGVERALLEVPTVRGARVNLSRKQVSINAPGVSPEHLIERLKAAGFDALPLDASLLDGADSDPEGRALLVRIAVAGFAMMNVMLFSVAVWSGASHATQTMFHWLSAAIAVPALAFSAQVFFKSAWSALKARRLNMDVPISLAIILAAGLSIYETAIAGEQVYFDAALSLTFFLLVGRYLDHRTRSAARSASQELAALESPRALRVDTNGARHVNVSELQTGDRIRVVAGMRIPVDGIIRRGASDIDRSLITGETLPVQTARGATVGAGELNLTAPIEIEVTAVGQDTTLRRMAALVETAESGRNRYTALADRAAAIYAPAVHLLALLTFLGWSAVGLGFAPALNIAISVLIITCPCALGLAVPAVSTAAAGWFFRHGLLVKDATAIERLAEVDTIVFDKTGTLTTGRADLDTSELSESELSVLAALSAQSSHPVARAIAAAIPSGHPVADLSEVREIPGCGISARWNGKEVRLGKGDWVDCAASPALRIAKDTPIGIEITETLREGAETAISQLQAAGFDVQILSGDRADTTARLAARIGIAQAQGELAPQDKMHHLAEIRAAGRKVLMVGDGLNDTGALTTAHASISPASALDASRAASDIVLLGRSLAEIPFAIRTARSARRRVIENFAIAGGYNMIAIPVAVLGFATPLSAAIAMSASSITVLLNALRVRGRG